MVELTGQSKKTVEIEAEPKKVFDFLTSYAKSAKCLPGVRKFSKVKPDVFRWEFEPKGPGKYAIEVCYDTRFETVKNKEVRWKSIPGSGNAEVEGVFTVEPRGKSTQLTLDLNVVSKIDIPFLLKPVAQKMARSELENTVTTYLGNLKSALET